MKKKRTRLFVDRSVQGAILLRLIVHWIVFLFAAGLILYFVELLSGSPRDAGQRLVVRHGPTVLAVLALAPIFLRDLCKLTNRFAGPMVRLQRAMHDLGQGRDVAAVHFREHDFWNELAADFNRVVERTQEAEARSEYSQDSDAPSFETGGMEERVVV